MKGREIYTQRASDFGATMFLHAAADLARGIEEWLTVGALVRLLRFRSRGFRLIGPVTLRKRIVASAHRLDFQHPRWEIQTSGNKRIHLKFRRKS